MFKFMTLLRWQAKILNQIFKTDRYHKLSDLKLDSPEQIDYKIFYELTPQRNPQAHAKIIDAVNKLCKPKTPATSMQQEVAFLNQYYSSLNKEGEDGELEKVVIYSSLSKCRIWPKVLKSGQGFVPELITFYNDFTKQYNCHLEFKFDPVILTQKFTKIMKKANLKKKDSPQLAITIKNDDIPGFQFLIEKMKQEIAEESQGEQSRQKFVAENLNSVFHQGKCLTHLAVMHASLNFMRLLWELGMDYEGLDDESQTPIFYAIKRNEIQVLKFLTQEVKVNLNHRQYQMRTPLYLAAFQGYVQIIDFLIKQGADPQLCSKLDRTPLSKACYLGNVEVVKYLLNLKVDILKQDNKGRTALHNAVWGIEGGREGKRKGHIMLQDSPECAELMIQAGHPVDFEDYDGYTPLFSAVSSMAVRSIDLLKKYGADFKHKTHKKQNCAFIAAKYGHLKVLRKLIQEQKCQFFEKDVNGYTPICAAITLTNPEVFFYLCDKHIQKSERVGLRLLLQCCRVYSAVPNFKYLLSWIQTNSNQEMVDKILMQEVYDLRKIIDQFNNFGISHHPIPHHERMQENEEEMSRDWDLKQKKTKVRNSEKEQKTGIGMENGFGKNMTEQYKNQGFLIGCILEIMIHMLERSLPIKEQAQLLMEKCITFFNEHPTHVPEDLVAKMISVSKKYAIGMAGVEIIHHHSERDQIRLFMSGVTHLTETNEDIWKSLSIFCKQRKAGVIIKIFNSISLAKDDHPLLNKDNLLNLVTWKPEDKLSLIEYCLVNGISDIAVYLQSALEHSIGNTAHHSVMPGIPVYEICSHSLSQKEIAINIEPTEPWIFNYETLVRDKLSEEEKKKYRIITERKEGEGVMGDMSKFTTSGNFMMVDSLQKLDEMKWKINKSVLIGIDVEHYNENKDEHFVCSIQISAYDGVYILDPFAELNGKDLTRDQITHFLRTILEDKAKVKILHAYENDLKWINQDYGISQTKLYNVIDTNRIYQSLTSKKNISIGLKTLAQNYLNYNVKKDFQRADWRIRPLFKEMIEYAAIDAEILPYVFLAMMNKNIGNSNKIIQVFSSKKSFRSRGVRHSLRKKQEIMAEQNQGF